MIIRTATRENWSWRNPGLWSLGSPYKEGVVVEVGWIQKYISSLRAFLVLR